jgi:prepilin-type N-terminal cleavage/methylation domain-containing protein
MRIVHGFTLIEILVVIGMAAILSTAVLVAVNPLRQFAQVRNIKRQHDVALLLEAVTQKIISDGGIFATTTDTSSAGCPQKLPSSFQKIGDMKSNQMNLYACIVPRYIADLPRDPSVGYLDCPIGQVCYGTHFELGYSIRQDPVTHQVTVCAPNAAEPALPGSTAFCLTR